MSFHPTVFNLVESVLGIFATTNTLMHQYIAGHVCISWTLLHLFSSITRLFELGFSFLTHLYQSHHTVLTKPTSHSGDKVDLLRSCTFIAEYNLYSVD